MGEQYKIFPLPDPSSLIDDYYRTLDNIALQKKLSKFFRHDSEMQFNGEEFRGPRKIVERLVPEDLDTIVHVLTTQDYQPLTHGQYLVSVIGTVSANGGPEIQFSTIFVLETFAAKEFFIKYLIVRANICKDASEFVSP